MDVSPSPEINFGFHEKLIHIYKSNSTSLPSLKT
jgi:hypothetical protein